MKRIITTATCLCLATVLLTSCVAKHKYIAARSRAEQARIDNLALNARITGLQDTISRLHNRITEMNGRIGALGNANETTASELNMSKEQIAAQRARLSQLESFLSTQQKASEDLRKKISDALEGFNSNELTVTMKDGRVYVSMQEALLFPSGSADVNPRGKEALAKLASVLNANTDINTDIEGHTDNKPIHSKIYADNWALSTARATSIARVLIDNYNVSPARLIASGRSYYHPIASNDTPEGRAQNRRTEIILEPKLDELMQLMNPNMAGK
jgi:chemotaxis protein MotB